ncbi:hypothetical protein O1611_g2604 [Lasiodiplodia mahajangana]|uniref:Uncharacterized protein n=1 Tax=Lasiodiplodia mahajangana TaxID=1108764 RepID=A0ACC2JUL8_9PEZI|nr:hypothetical protein O1611_g2604 [Lasiodiplodia mahajangana]
MSRVAHGWWRRLRGSHSGGTSTYKQMHRPPASQPRDIELPVDSSIDDALSQENASTLLQSIDTIIKGSFTSPETGEDVHEAVFDVTWQIQQCIRDELESNPDLGPVLTVTGDSQHSWATTCREYVRTTWKEDGLGEQFLMDLEILLGRKFPSSEVQPSSRLRSMLCPIDEEAFEISRLVFEGTTNEISTLGQFLAWITASFRLPHAGQVACSSVDFRDTSHSEDSRSTFRISLRDLSGLDDRPGTCWKALFPSTILAYGFTVPIFPGTRGLRIPFEAMLGMADILYDVNLEGGEGKGAGIYFDGILYTLYPTAYVQESRAIQWHLKSKIEPLDGDQDRTVAPDSGGAPRWERIPDFETLQSATAILG